MTTQSGDALSQGNTAGCVMATHMCPQTPTGTRLNDLVEKRFPLLPRGKARCRSLTDRINRVRHQADLAGQDTDDSILRAAEAHNLAALVTSDCSMPTVARELCWR